MLKQIIIIIIIAYSTTFSQNKYDFDQFANEGVDYLTAPFHWEAKEFLLLGLTAGVTFGAMQFDVQMKKFTQKDRSENSPIPILAGRFYGEPLTPVILGSYFIINGNSNGNSFQKKLGFEIAQASFYALATTQIFKILFGRERPHRTDDHLNFTGPTFFNNDFFALPSGHTTVAFAVSTVLSENSSNDLLKIISFVPAFLTAYSRIYENRHWLSDVILGGIIGYTSAKFFTHEHERKEQFVNPEPTPLFNFTFPLN